MPTDAQLQGNFAGGRTITDPNTGQPFPNNQIPANRIDPNALSLIRNWYARPVPGFQSGALNYTSSEPDGTRYRSALGRLDYNRSEKLTFFGRYNIDSTRLDSPYGLFQGNTMPISAPSQQAHIMYTANASANWTISPTLLNQTTLSWYHGSMAIVTLPVAARAKAADFTVPRYFNTITDSAGLIPSISMSQGYAGIAVAWPQNISHYTFEFIDNLSYIRGRHTFKFGGTVSRDNKTQNSSNINNNGTFAFNGGVTGDSLADLLLGRAFSYTETSDHKMGSAIFTDTGLYAQDQFRATDRLSVTLGVRWEYFQPEHANDGLATYFDPKRFDPAKAPTVLPANGEIVLGTQNFGNGVVVACDPGNPFGCAITNSSHNVFDPRVGFSYQLTHDGKTVLRGGYGIFHDRWAQYISSTRNNYPINQNISIYNTSFSNPGQGTRRIFPGNFTSENSPWRVPSLQKWSLDLQRQLPGDLVAPGRIRCFQGLAPDPDHRPEPARGERCDCQRQRQPECVAAVPRPCRHYELPNDGQLGLPLVTGIRSAPLRRGLLGTGVVHVEQINRRCGLAVRYLLVVPDITRSFELRPATHVRRQLHLGNPVRPEAYRLAEEGRGRVADFGYQQLPDRKSVHRRHQPRPGGNRRRRPARRRGRSTLHAEAAFTMVQHQHICAAGARHSSGTRGGT